MAQIYSSTRSVNDHSLSRNAENDHTIENTAFNGRHLDVIRVHPKHRAPTRQTTTHNSTTDANRLHAQHRTVASTTLLSLLARQNNTFQLAPLVQPPARLDGHVRLGATVQQAVQRRARPLQDGGVRNVEAVTRGGQKLTRLERLGLPLLCKRHIAPTLRETIGGGRSKGHPVRWSYHLLLLNT